MTFQGGDKINYIMIPKDIIYRNEMSDKRVLLFSYFAFKRGLDDTVGFSCNSIVEWCGYKQNYNKNKINEQITDCINQLSSVGYLNIKDVVVRNNHNEATLIHEKFNVDSQFALLYFDEIEKIRCFKKYTKDVNRMSPSLLILVLSYLRVNMLRRQNGYLGDKSDKPEFCYRMYIDMEKDIGISSRYISRAVKILGEMDLIVSEEMPRYKDEYDNWHTDVTLFANKHKRESGGESLDINYNYVQEIEWGKEYIFKRKYINKKFDQS